MNLIVFTILLQNFSDLFVESRVVLPSKAQVVMILLVRALVHQCFLLVFLKRDCFE